MAVKTPVKGKVYVGKYEARATPIADTDSATSLPSTIKMVPGTYDFVFQANGYGLKRFTATVTAGQHDDQDAVACRRTSRRRPTARRSTVRAPNSLNTGSLIDDTENTNWAGVDASGVSVDTAHPFVNVDLAGGKQKIKSVVVSAMLRPAADDDNDADAGQRFTALRQFAIEVCSRPRRSTARRRQPSTTTGSPYKRIYTSPADAFDGVRPRPLAPALLAKSFDVPDTSATHVRLVVLAEPVHRSVAVRRRAGQRPGQRHRLQVGLDGRRVARAAELEVFGRASVGQRQVVVRTAQRPLWGIQGPRCDHAGSGRGGFGGLV